jgi:hypothetical protein
MKRRRFPRWLAITLAILVAVGIGIAVPWNTIVRFALPRVVGMATGMNVSVGSVSMHHGTADLRNLRLTAKNGERFATIPRVVVKYNLGDLLHGSNSRHKYGLRAFTVYDPHITVVRNRDGTYNLPNLPKSAPSKAKSAPYNMSVRVIAGSLSVTNVAAVQSSAKTIRVGRINLTATIDTAARTTYRASMAYLYDGRSYPIRGVGIIDKPLGINLQHFTAAKVPLPQLIDYALNNTRISMRAGSLQNLNARYYGKITASAQMVGGEIAIPGTDALIRNVNGPLDVTSAALTTPRITATVAGAPVYVAGGIYDLAHPQFRLTVSAQNDLARLKHLSSSLAKLPMAGTIGLSMLVEGPVRAPLALIGVSSPQIVYRTLTLATPSGTIAFTGKTASVLHFTMRYAGFSLAARGRVALKKEPRAVEAVASASGSSDAVPYAASFLPGVPLQATVLATAPNLKSIETQGVLNSVGGSQIDAAFDVNGSGVGDAALALGATRAKVAIDHPHAGITAFLQARNLKIRRAQVASVPGFRTKSVPPIDATLNGDMMAVERSGSFALDGDVAASNLTFGSTRAAYADVAVSTQGPLTAPNATGALVIAKASLSHYFVDGSAAFALSGSTLHFHDGLAGVGPALVAFDGTAGGIHIGAPISPQLDLHADTQAADLHSLLALVSPKLSKQGIQGDVSANLTVRGSAKSPAIAGGFAVTAGSVHGLAFRDMRGTLGGTAQAFAVRNGHVKVGSTALSFHASAGRGSFGVGMKAPHAQLADFNDYFNDPDLLAGTGSLAVSVASSKQTFLTNGNVNLGNVRFDAVPIGSARAHWRTSNQTISMRASIGGKSGIARVNGSAVLPRNPTIAALATNSDVNATAAVRHLDLATWLPLLGYHRIPVTGFVDADASARGRYPDVTLNATARIAKSVVNRVPLQRAQIALRAVRGRGTLEQAIVRVPYLSANASGTFGFHASDPLALRLTADSSDVGKLAQTFSGRANTASGALAAAMTVTGTRKAPQFAGTIALTSAQYNKLAVPRIAADLTGNLRSITLKHGEVDLKRGRIVATATLPLHLTKAAPVAMNASIQNVDFSSFESAFPKGYTLAGTMGGAMSVAGDIDHPLFNGSIALHNAYFVGPVDQNPVQKINGTMAFSGDRITIPSLVANVGGGSMRMAATAIVPNFRRPSDATFSGRIVAKDAQINNPKYFRGKVNANVTFSRAGGTAIPLIAGTVDVPSARIPLSAFWNPHAPKHPVKTPIALAFNLNATVGNDVRVQSTGVDVGAMGHVAVTGTLKNPKLNGAFTSTGGTISFVRTFTIQSATAQFQPSNGIMPYVDAIATTYIASPPNTVALHVTGLAPNEMHIAFDSTGGYSRTQILAMLSGLSNPNATGGGLVGFSAQNELQNLAMGELNAYFTQQLLEPLSASLGNALGLQNLQLSDNFASGFGVNAVKAFGKHITAVFGETFGQPQRESLSISVHKSEYTAFDLMFYNIVSSTLISRPVDTNTMNFQDYGNAAVLAPMLGNNGYMFRWEHKFN